VDGRTRGGTRPVVRLGIVTPVVTLLPRAHGPWERDADLEAIVAVAEDADRLGYHHLTCSEHVAVPREIAEVRGARYWDPLATFGYLAARTSRIRLATHVLVLGYHHPLEIAKRYGTLDRVCGGRLILGVGVGSLREEFDLLGAAFDDRGARADDALRALRASLSQTEPEYQGDTYGYEGLVVDPSSVQEHVPIWIGGRTARSLRRAVALADGWTPFGLAPDELRSMLARARASAAWERRAAPLDLVLTPERALDPSGDPERARLLAGELVDVGATVLNLRFVSHSLAHYREQLHAMHGLGSSL
jgi:probable F420-dependent oxidoreductase